MSIKLKYYLLALLVAIFLWFVDSRGYFNWLKRPVAKWSNPVRHTLYLNKVTPVTEAKIDLAEKAILEAELIKVKKENESIRNLLETPLPPNWKFWPGKIVKLSTTNMTIDIGKESKVIKGMTVMGIKKDKVNNGIVVGRIKSVNLMSSEVELIASEKLQLKAITESEVKGVVKEVENKLMLTEVLQEHKLIENELILTEGKDGFIPGLVIGRVGAISKVDTAIFQQAEMKPVIDVNQLEQVFVVALPTAN